MLIRNIALLILFFLIQSCACDFVGLTSIEQIPTPHERTIAEQNIISQEKITSSIEDANAVYFEYKKTTLSEHQLLQLDFIARSIILPSKEQIVIAIHSDNLGSIKYNRFLGRARFNFVKNYLAKMNIPEDKFVIRFLKSENLAQVLNIKKIENNGFPHDVQKATANSRKLSFVPLSKAHLLDQDHIAESLETLRSFATVAEKPVQALESTLNPETHSPSLTAIYFDYKSTVLNANQRSKLSSEISNLKLNSNQKIEISIKTDPIGSEEYNFQLGQKRAQSIISLLYLSGIRLTQVETKIIRSKSIPKPKLESELLKLKNEFKDLRKAEFNIIESQNESPKHFLALESVFFGYQKSILSKFELYKLKKNLEIIKDNPNIKIHITSYSDHTGSYHRNLKLSDKRARYIYKFFIKSGISKDRLTFESKVTPKPNDLLSEPIPNRSLASKLADQRRVEFTIYPEL